MLSLALITALIYIADASPSTVFSRQTAVTDLPDQWAFFGCFADITNSRVLNGATVVNSTAMTIESCVNFCNSQSFVYAGLEFGQECFCDNFFENTANKLADSQCTQACVGNPNQLCGSPGRLSVYTSGIPAVIPMQAPSVGLWKAQGCFDDSTDSRTLQQVVDVGPLTAELCTSACLSRGFTLAGLEFGHECWCGSRIMGQGEFVGNDNGITPGNPPVRITTGGPFCNMPCAGNPNELCGGPVRMNLYNFTGSTKPGVAPSVGDFLLLGCFPLLSTISEPLFQTQISLAFISAETCTAACLNQGFMVAGLTAGNKCFCESTRDFNNFKPGTIAQSACGVTCRDSPFQLCGGTNAYTVFQFENMTPVVSAFTSLQAPTKALIALINSVDFDNVQTVGPNIAPGVQGLVSAINTATSTATTAVNSGNNPLTGDFATNALNAFLSVQIDGVFGALGAQGTLLAHGFASPVLASIRALMTASVSAARACAFEIVPSLSSASLAAQSDFERQFASAAIPYTGV